MPRSLLDSLCDLFRVIQWETRVADPVGFIPVLLPSAFRKPAENCTHTHGHGYR